MRRRTTHPNFILTINDRFVTAFSPFHNLQLLRPPLHLANVAFSQSFPYERFRCPCNSRSKGMKEDYHKREIMEKTYYQEELLLGLVKISRPNKITRRNWTGGKQFFIILDNFPMVFFFYIYFLKVPNQKWKKDSSVDNLLRNHSDQIISSISWDVFPPLNLSDAFLNCQDIILENISARTERRRKD